MPGILHYVLNNVSTAYLFNQINGLKKYTSVVLGKEPAKDSKYNHHFPLGTDIEEIRKIVQRYDIKAIHAHFGHHGEKAVELSKQLNLPLITSLRGGEASNHPNKFNKNKKRYANLMKHGSLYLPVCKCFVPWLQNLGFPKDKIKVLYGGIDINLFSYKPRSYKKGEKIKLISVGKTAPKKGHRYLIKAMSILVRKYPNIELVIISQKNKNKKDHLEKKELRKLISKLGLKNKVKIIFDLNEPEIVQKLHQSHIFVQPSITTNDGNIEGIPNALKEAMATGMPVIATKHAGIPELVKHKKNGYLVIEKDSAKLAQAIIYFIKHPQKWSKYGSRARKMVKNHFKLRNQIVYQEELYDRLLE